MRRSLRLLLQTTCVKKEENPEAEEAGIEEQEAEEEDTSAVPVIRSKYFQSKKKSTARKHLKIEYQDDEESEVVSTKEEAEVVEDAEEKDGTFTLGKRKRTTTTKVKREKTKKAKKSSRVKEEQPEIEVDLKPGEKPDDWLEVYTRIKQMRKENPAPVDQMGCESLSDDLAAPEIKRYQTLISLMLSSQTRDEMTAKAMTKLRAHGLTVDKILATPDDVLSQLINNVCFYNRKTIYIKKTSQILKDKYNGDIPAELKDMLKLPGVGPKMAYLCMQCAWKRNEGIGVDTHVHRISNRLGWVKSSNPEETRKALEDWLPKDYWRPVNKMLVGFGQTICRPIGPRCSVCRVNDLCPTGKWNLEHNNNKASPRKRKRGIQIEVKEEERLEIKQEIEAEEKEKSKANGKKGKNEKRKKIKQEKEKKKKAKRAKND